MRHTFLSGNVAIESLSLCTAHASQLLCRPLVMTFCASSSVLPLQSQENEWAAGKDWPGLLPAQDAQLA